MAQFYVDSGGASTNSGTSDNASPDLSGTANATVPANQTFVDADVNTGTDIITKASHGFTTGLACQLSTSGTLPTGLTLLTDYIIGVLSSSTFALYKSVADANANTNKVDITAAAGGGTHTVNVRGVILGGSPTLTSLIAESVRVTTTGTSHVLTTVGGLHGGSTGDYVTLEVASGGTMPTGLTEKAGYYMNALSTSTLRLYTTKALAVAGGASDINVSAAEVRTLRLRNIPNSAINIASATNSNRKIFHIRSVDNTNKIVNMADTVTGLGAGSNWAIGGRVDGTGLNDVLRALRGNDHIMFNTDITMAATGATTDSAADTEASGFINFTGKSGARRVWARNGGDFFNAFSPSTRCNIHCTNLEFQHQGASGSFIANGSANYIFNACRITDWNSNFTGSNLTNIVLIDSEVTGGGGWGANSNSTTLIYRSYVHDNSNSNDSVRTDGAGVFIIDSIIERGSDRGLEFVGGTFTLVSGSTIYRHDNDGIGQGSSLNQFVAVLMILDNIIADNGNASTEANIALPYRPGVLIERRNNVSIAGARGGVNTVGDVSLDASDVTGDPQFVDADNGTPASRDFGLKYTSPARGALQMAFLGGGGTTYRDLGAVQRRENSPRARSLIGI